MHKAGEWMFSYRYMFMRMKGNRSGTSGLTSTDVLNNFMVSPTDMNMEMHMLGGMWAPLDQITFMVMLPIVSKEMDHVTRTGTSFTTKSRGLGDLKMTGLFKLLKGKGQQLHSNFSLSVPTGSIKKKDDTPSGTNQQLPYPMQLGSGTIDLFPGITYLGQLQSWSWGGQAIGTIRIAENNNDYSLGDQYELTWWGARIWFDWLSSSVRMSFQHWFDIDGADPALNPAMVPTADPSLRGGKRLDLLFGINSYISRGVFSGFRFAVEGGLPIYQSLDGPQLETDWILATGIQYTL